VQLFRWDTHILANNLFGVDINSEPVEITKLSLWLKTANRQEKLTYLDDNIRQGNSVVDDPAVAGHLAFNWSAQFHSVLGSGGYDVVLANPPYLDSEEMVRSGQASARDFISENYKFAKGNWDIYIAFLERAYLLLNARGVLCFITPDKWLSKPFGAEARKGLLPGLVSVARLGRDVFEDSLVDSIVTVVTKHASDKVDLLTTDEGRFMLNASFKTSELSPAAPLDELFSPHLPLLRKIELAGAKLKDFAVSESACATSDAYELKEILADLGPGAGNDNRYFKVVNTGTLDKFVFRWGRRRMRYLKDDYQYPVVEKSSFERRFGADYVRRSAAKKLIIKGITLLDGALDLEGEYVPGKSTLVITHTDVPTLKIIAAFVNSRVASFYVREKYSSASYNTGVVFTKDMINELPLPINALTSGLERDVDSIVARLNEFQDLSWKFVKLVRAEFGLATVSGRIERWYENDFGAFLEELEKLGVAISLPKKAEWIDHFDAERALALEAVRKVGSSIRDMNAKIYGLYGLADEDIKVIDSQ
jgi:Eco57I restriction-modification methylase